MKSWGDWIAMMVVSCATIGFASMGCGYFVLTRCALRATDPAERRKRLKQLCLTMRAVHRPWMDVRGLLLILIGAALGAGAFLVFGIAMLAFLAR